MDNVEMAIQKVCASKVYTSAEFKRERDTFNVSDIETRDSNSLNLISNLLLVPLQRSGEG